MYRKIVERRGLSIELDEVTHELSMNDSEYTHRLCDIVVLLSLLSEAAFNDAVVLAALRRTFVEAEQHSNVTIWLS